MAEYLDKNHVLKLGDMDPELQAFLKANPPPPIDYSDVVVWKKLAADNREAGMKALGPCPPEIKATFLEYTTADGAKVPAKLYQPNPLPKDGCPLIVMFHGGGFCVGDHEGEEQSCRNFVQAFGAVCISCTYRLAPEFKFPHAADDAWDALKWAAASAKSWGADPTAGFVVGGTSAGGNLTGVVSHLARDNHLSPPLTGQYLSIPFLIPEQVIPDKYKEYYMACEQNKDAPVLPRGAVDMFTNAYDPDIHDGVRYAVINHPGGHGNQPPAMFQVSGLDMLRDDGLIYERILREEYGIKTKLFVYPGQPHGFHAFFPFLKAADQYRKDQLNGMGWLLGRTADFSKAKLGAVPTQA